MNFLRAYKYFFNAQFLSMQRTQYNIFSSNDHEQEKKLHNNSFFHSRPEKNFQLTASFRFELVLED